MSEPKSHFERWSDIIAKTPSPRERQVYTGKNMAGDIFIRAEAGGYAPLVTMRVEKDGFEILLHLGDGGAEEIGNMLLAAAAATKS